MGEFSALQISLHYLEKSAYSLNSIDSIININFAMPQVWFLVFHGSFNIYLFCIFHFFGH